MTNTRVSTQVRRGDSLLTNRGRLLITEIERYGVSTMDAAGEVGHLAWGEIVLAPSRQATDLTLTPWWNALSDESRQVALFRLEVVNEILTGYRSGHPAIAHEREPASPFDDPKKNSRRVRIQAMVRQLQWEDDTSREVARRSEAARAVTVPTIYNWIRDWQKHGLRGLVDGRSTRDRAQFDALDWRFRAIADEVFAEFDGTSSVVQLKEIRRRVNVLLKQRDVEQLEHSNALAEEYLSHRWNALGFTSRAHRSRSQRRVSSTSSFPAVHPSHVVIDATRADNLVWDEVQQRPYSVEILTVISVATRVVVALRVVPQSARSVEAALTLYDAMRPFSMVVEGSQIEDFRWCGVPESLDFTNPEEWLPKQPVSRPDRDLQGVHHLPGVRPSSLRADNGSIFTSVEFRELLRSFGIDLLLSRGSRPVDNSQVERWHETLQPAYQQIPGYKGRAVHERGRHVGVRKDEPLLTAHELEQHLKRFVVLKYHRTKHKGLHLPHAPGVNLTPLEMWDAMTEATGRIHVPQHPDLIYQFLPVIWRKVRHDGVTHNGLTYDDRVLDDFRDLRKGAFRQADDRAPFHHDPRDSSRLWFRHPETHRISEIGWRARHLLHAPMGDTIVTRARQLVRARPDLRSADSHRVEAEIVEQIHQITRARSVTEWKAEMSAARLRYEQALADHAEVTEANRVRQAQEDLAAGAALLPAGDDVTTTGPAVPDERWPDLGAPDFDHGVG